jgi:DNA-binding SARP family transcriptional activator
VASFRVLGPVEAWTDERRLMLGGPQQVKLLAFLLLNANRAVSADAVIDAVWGPEREGAAKRLQMGVFRLRKAFAPLDSGDGSRLRTVSGGYLLAVRPGEFDADVFADRLRDGRRALEEDDPARASELLAEALALWRGPPLAEVAFEDFAQSEIRRLEELRLVALETRIAADLTLGRHANLIPELDALLSEQPTREHLAGQLMTALYRAGRQADALEVYQQTRTHLGERLGLEPGPMLKALQGQILEQAPALQAGFEHHPALSTPRPSRRPFPSPATPTIGREQELREISLLLLQRSGSRLVTLTGPGGVGKTRLALVVADLLEHEFEQGVCWVELAGVTRSDDVASTLVRGLDATPAPGERATDTLLRYLADKQLLLVVDNFEHVLEAAGLISDMLASCPRLLVLTTSREVLDIAAEHRYDVAPLSVPPRPDQASVDEVEATPGTALFLAAARRRKLAFAIDPATAPLVARVCARLDGLPLAVELAAARVGVLTISELAARLNDAAAGLGPGPRDAPERQQTLQATIRWSYRLLRDEE